MAIFTPIKRGSRQKICNLCIFNYARVDYIAGNFVCFFIIEAAFGFASAAPARNPWKEAAPASLFGLIFPSFSAVFQGYAVRIKLAEQINAIAWHEPLRARRLHDLDAAAARQLDQHFDRVFTGRSLFDRIACNAAEDRTRDRSDAGLVDFDLLVAHRFDHAGHGVLRAHRLTARDRVKT